MKRHINTCLIAVVLVVNSQPAYSQGGNGRGDCYDKYSLHYYKIAPGKHDEWLALFKKWHLPIMEYRLKHKEVTEMKLFAAGSHSIQPDFDFAAMYRTSTDAKKAPLGRADIIRKLFGKNMDEYVAAEKRRWEITLKHWDQPMKVMDPYEEPFSVFLPIGGDCK